MDFTLHGGFAAKYDDFMKEDQRRYFFMYRKTDDGIPNFDKYSAAETEMPNYCMVGMGTGNFLNSVTFLSKQVSMIATPIILKHIELNFS